MKKSLYKKRAFTLIEAMMAVLILGIITASALLPFTTGAAVQAEGTRRTLAAKLAADLMEEITNTPFANIASNYDGYSEPQGQIKDAGGSVFTNPLYSKLSRSSSCVYVYVPQENQNGASKFILVTVKVSHEATEIAQIKRLITK